MNIITLTLPRYDPQIRMPNGAQLPSSLHRRLVPHHPPDCYIIERAGVSEHSISLLTLYYLERRKTYIEDKFTQLHTCNIYSQTLGRSFAPDYIHMSPHIHELV